MTTMRKPKTKITQKVRIIQVMTTQLMMTSTIMVMMGTMRGKAKGMCMKSLWKMTHTRMTHNKMKCKRLQRLLMAS